MEYVYPAIFKKEDDGGFFIHFPDLESCYTSGENLQDGIEMAEDVLCLMLYDMEIDGVDIPAPSNIKEIKARHDDLVTLIKCDTMEYRTFHNNKAVKKTLSIPGWLNKEAVAKGVNFSATLQEALKRQLGL